MFQSCQGPVAQRLEPATHNRLVGGSNPSRPISVSDPYRVGNADFSGDFSKDSRPHSGRCKGFLQRTLRGHIASASARCSTALTWTEASTYTIGCRTLGTRINNIKTCDPSPMTMGKPQSAGRNNPDCLQARWPHWTSRSHWRPRRGSPDFASTPEAYTASHSTRRASPSPRRGPRR